MAHHIAREKSRRAFSDLFHAPRLITIAPRRIRRRTYEVARFPGLNREGRRVLEGTRDEVQRPQLNAAATMLAMSHNLV